MSLGIGEVSLRPYEADRDAEVVARIVGRIWSGGDAALMEERFGIIGNNPWGHWQAKAVLDYFNAPACRAFVAQESGQVIGFCSYLLDQGRSIGTVGYNGIAPEHQGRKLGSAMMRFVMERLHEAGVQYAAVIVADNDQHAPARRVYEKYGFENLMGMHYMVQKL